METLKDNKITHEPTNYDREEEYLAAQRAAVESIMVGRETLEAAVRQGEQLRNAENLADETEYKLDRATRLLKGMTWAGWFANKFTSDIEAPQYKTKSDVAPSGPPRVYEDVPTSCMDAAQAIQNYHCNIDVLEKCERDDQRETCKIICNNMYDFAIKAVAGLDESDQESNEFRSRLRKDLATLRSRQQSSGRLSRVTTASQGAPGNKDETKVVEDERSKLSPQNQIMKQQEDHLDAMARHLGELGSLATNLNASLQDHSNTLEVLDEKMETQLVKSNIVTRRTDRLIQKKVRIRLSGALFILFLRLTLKAVPKSWKRIKPEYISNFSIQHIKTGKYLSVTTSNSLFLSSKYNEQCIFSLWKRQGKIFGLKSKYSKKWVGQNLFGALVCNATKFDRREEWDVSQFQLVVLLIRSKRGLLFL